MRKHRLVAGAAAMAAAALVPTPASQLAVAQEPAQKIVYARTSGQQDLPKTHELYLMHADGSAVVRLTRNAREDSFPALSPDGERVAFARRIRGQFDLFVTDVAGGETTRLTKTSNADEVLPAWSPDGGKLAFTATTDTPGGWQSDIYRIRLQNGRFRRLTHTPVAKEFAPDWAPDGTLIAFTKQVNARDRYGIATVRPGGRDVAWLVVNPRSGEGYTDVNPSWSPDSQWVAFSRDHGDDPYVDVYKVARDGQAVEPVTELSELAENPVWGADGRILFMHNEGLAVVSSEGGEVRHLTPVATGLPYWWPDW